MSVKSFLLLISIFSWIATSKGQPQFRLAEGVYRIPYTDGTQVRITNDHLTHSPQGRIDMRGINGSSPYHVAAAGEGIIRFIDDTHANADCNGGGCAACNNYVWIEHPNGEWTKYTHFAEGSVTNLGWQVGEQINAGQFLGLESDVGCASGVHLHFEVAVPNDPMNPINPVGGFIIGVNRVPIICGIPSNYFIDNETYTADDCTSSGCPFQANVANFNLENGDVFVEMAVNITVDDVISLSGSASLFQASQLIRFMPGYEAHAGCEVIARISDCNLPPWDNLTSPNNGNQIIVNGNSKSQKEMPAVRLGKEDAVSTLLLYPNPFFKDFQVKFHLPAPAQVSLRLLDALGKPCLLVLAGETKDAGSHSLKIHAENLPPGIYFLEITAGQERQIRRVLKFDD